jgi:hypothetical protein
VAFAAVAGPHRMLPTGISALFSERRPKTKRLKRAGRQRHVSLVITLTCDITIFHKYTKKFYIIILLYLLY